MPLLPQPPPSVTKRAAPDIPPPQVIAEAFSTITASFRLSTFRVPSSSSVILARQSFDLIIRMQKGLFFVVEDSCRCRVWGVVVYDFVPPQQKNSLACCTSSNPTSSLLSEGRSCS